MKWIWRRLLGRWNPRRDHSDCTSFLERAVGCLVNHRAARWQPRTRHLSLTRIWNGLGLDPACRKRPRSRVAIIGTWVAPDGVVHGRNLSRASFRRRRIGTACARYQKIPRGEFRARAGALRDVTCESCFATCERAMLSAAIGGLR